MKNDFITSIVGNLIASYLKGDLTELDLYNSILRLIYSSDKETKGSLNKVIAFLNEIEGLTEEERKKQYYLPTLETNVGQDYVEGLNRIFTALKTHETDEEDPNNNLKLIDELVDDKVSAQYNKRIDYVRKSNKSESEKEDEIAKLVINCTFDPRRPTVTYTSREQAEKSIKVQEILDSLTDEEFLTDSYVLNWHDLLNN